MGARRSEGPFPEELEGGAFRWQRGLCREMAVDSITQEEKSTRRVSWGETRLWGERKLRTPGLTSDFHPSIAFSVSGIQGTFSCRLPRFPPDRM